MDYLKEDSCGGETHGSVWDQYARMRDGLNATGRPVYFSVTQSVAWPISAASCYGASAFTTRPWVAAGLDPGDLANGFLVEYSPPGFHGFRSRYSGNVGKRNP